MSYLFPECSRDEIASIAGYSVASSCHTNQIVLYEGSEPEQLHIVCSGRVRIYKIGIKNEEIVLRDIDPVSMVGEMANVKRTLFPASIRCLKASLIARVNYLKLCAETFFPKKVMPILLDSISDKLHYHVNVNFQYTYSNLSAQVKTAAFLQDNLALFNSMKRWEVARVLNITPETLSRMLGRLMEQGCIAMSGKRIEIQDEERLRRVVLGD